MSKKFEHLINTGSSSILEDRTTIEDKNKEATVFENYITISKSILTGHFSTRISIEGKTLFEEYPDLQIINQTEYFSIESGDYYVKKDFHNDGKIYLKDQYENGSYVLYESKDIDSGSMAFQGTTGLNIVQNQTIPEITGKLTIDSPSDLNDFFDRWDVFFDGVKMYEYDYQEYDSQTGLAFAYKKNEDLLQITGYNPDIYNVGFLPNQYDFYVDGLEKPLDSTLELYNGVNLIETGVYSYIDIDINKEHKFYL